MVCHNSRKSIFDINIIFRIPAFFKSTKDVPGEVLEALTKIKSIINAELIEESQNNQHKKYSVFEFLRDCSKQHSLAFMV